MYFETSIYTEQKPDFDIKDISQKKIHFYLYSGSKRSTLRNTCSWSTNKNMLKYMYIVYIHILYISLNLFLVFEYYCDIFQRLFVENTNWITLNCCFFTSYNHHTNAVWICAWHNDFIGNRNFSTLFCYFSTIFQAVR